MATIFLNGEFIEDTQAATVSAFDAGSRTAWDSLRR